MSTKSKLVWALLAVLLMAGSSAWARGHGGHGGYGGRGFARPYVYMAPFALPYFRPYPYYYAPGYYPPSYYSPYYDPGYPGVGVPVPGAPQEYIERDPAAAAQPAAPEGPPAQAGGAGAQSWGTSPSPDAWWYWCPQSRGYYPYVRECAVPWQRVAPQPPTGPVAPDAGAPPSPGSR